MALPPPPDAPTPTATPEEEPPVAEKTPRVPAGYVNVSVLGVHETAEGNVVLLVDDARSVVLPIFIGGTEALSIELRNRHERYERPLTHDLFDATMKALGGELVRVQVDELRDSTYIGTIFVRRPNGKVIDIDARPSDAIALALGNRVPIYVAQQVLDQAGIKKDAEEDDTPPTPRI